MRLDGKVALITGATGGMGSASAQHRLGRRDDRGTQRRILVLEVGA